MPLGTFLVLDTTNYTFGDTGTDIPVLGEATYEWTGTPTTSTSAAAYSVSFTGLGIDGTTVTGWHYGSSSIDYHMSDGNDLNNAAGYSGLFELSDGRVLLAVGDADSANVANVGLYATSPADAILANGSAIDSVDINTLYGTGTSNTTSYYLTGEPTPTTAYSAPCFTAGTLIDTDRGLVLVETLKAGDKVRTKDHGFQPVRWIGESRVYATGFDVPLRIKAGTFNNTRDLVVSKRHKMLMNHTHLSLMFDVEEAFACAMHLRNDDTITREPEGWVTYYHILLPQHEVIFAEGAATESFYPDEGTLAGMAKDTKAELLKNFDPETYGPPARLTFDPMRAMWIGRNLDILNGDDMGQIAAYENAMKAAE